MKKIVLLLVIFTLKAEVQAQALFDATDIYSDIVADEIVQRDPSSGCINSVQFNFITPTLLDSQVGIWKIGYRYEINIHGVFGDYNDSSSNFRKEIISSTTFSPRQYSSINENDEYVYSATHDETLDGRDGYFDRFYATITVKKMWTNNDPGFTLFYSATGYNKSRYLLYQISYVVPTCLSTDELNKPDLLTNRSNLVINARYMQDGFITIYENRNSVNIPNLEIRNKGLVSSPASRLSYYVSLKRELDGTARRWKNFSIPALAPGQIYKVPDHDFGGKDIGGLPATRSNKWKILMKIDSNNRISETDENNNLVTLFTFINQNFKKAYIPDIDFDPDNPCRAEPCELGFKSVSKPYDLHVYNMYGQQIKKVTVKNKSEETYIIKGLNNGLYILKTENGSRKIYVDK